jgi:hypothetical protein
MSSSPSRTVPALARSAPVTRPISVLLPAPFGPINACRLPGSTARSTPSTAVSAPNERLSP